MRVVVALLVLLVATSARADDRDVGVVVAKGGALGAEVEVLFEKQLQKQGYRAIERPLAPKALDTLSNCYLIEDVKCARGVIEARAKTPRVIYARIELSDSGSLVLDITWFAAGNDPVTLRTACDDCGNSWQLYATQLLERLVSTAPLPISEGDGPERARTKPPKSKLWPRILITAGVLTAIGGGVTLYYGLRDGAEHKYIYPQLTPVGISLLAVGGGAAIGGLFWGGTF